MDFLAKALSLAYKTLSGPFQTETPRSTSSIVEETLWPQAPAESPRGPPAPAQLTHERDASTSTADQERDASQHQHSRPSQGAHQHQHSRPRERRQPVPCYLLLLPDELLDVILRRCAADDACGLIFAACAHTRLHHAVYKSKTAAVLAVRSIRAVLPRRQKVGDVLEYLGKYGQPLHSLDLAGSRSSSMPSCRFPIILQQLPHNDLQELRSISLSEVRVQLLPGNGYPGVLGPGTDLTQLQLHSCKVLDGEARLATALAQLPKLQRLSIVQACVFGYWDRCPLPTTALQSLQHLTHLELAGDKLQDAHSLHHLQGLTRLQHLRLSGLQPTIQASMLSGLHHLTHLEVTPTSDPNQQIGSCSSGVFEPGALAGKTQLQLVQLFNSSIAGGPAGVAELLSHLQHMNQTKTFIVDKPVAPGCVTPHVTLKANVQLQIVSISAKLSSQQVFSIAKQFPHLRALEVDICCQGRAACLDTSCLVSCCPGLQSLVTPGFVYSAGEVALLSDLSGLTKLGLCPDSYAWDEVCQLQQLRHLDVRIPSGKEGEGLQLLRELTKLQQLTCLDFHGGDSSYCLTVPPAGNTPMSQEVLLHIRGCIGFFLSFLSFHISGREEAQRLKQLAQQGPQPSSGLGGATHQQGPAGTYSEHAIQQGWLDRSRRPREPRRRHECFHMSDTMKALQNDGERIQAMIAMLDDQ